METNLQEGPQEPVADGPVVPHPVSHRRILAILALVVIVAAAGIFMFANLTKDEPVAATSGVIDPAGVWYYLDADSFTLSTIDLDPSGSLVADIYWGAEDRTVTHYGSWSYEGEAVQILLNDGLAEYWDVGRDTSGNEIMTYRDSSDPTMTVSMPGTIAYRSQELMEKNK